MSRKARRAQERGAAADAGFVARLFLAPWNPALPVLTAALVGLRHTLAGTRFTLRLPRADDATKTAAATVAQLDDYLLPRLRRLDARVPPAPDLEGGAGVDLGPDPAGFDRALGVACGNIEHRDPRSRRRDLGAPRHDFADEIVEQAQFERERAFPGAGDPGF